VTLTNRLSLFFVSALAVVLVGFSLAIYVIAARYVQRHLAEHLQTALDTLTASIEFDGEGAGFNAQERRVNLGSSLWNEAPVWLVCDQDGAILAQSSQPETTRLLGVCKEHHYDTSHDEKEERWQVSPWLIGRRWFAAAPPDGEARFPDPDRKIDDEVPRRLFVAVGVPRTGGEALLRKLATALGLLSLGIFAVGLVSSRAVCSRAIAPVRDMAKAARELQLAETPLRLPLVSAKDELGELHQAFNSLLDRLHDAWLRQTHFTTDVSHQLRTPLAAILGQIEVSTRRPRNTEEYQTVLGTVHDQAAQLKRIVESVLLLARAKSGVPTQLDETIDLAVWLPKHCESWKQHPRFADIQHSSDVPLNCWVRCAPALIEQLLDILLDNACKYSPVGSPITISTKTTPERVFVLISDQGFGIASHELPFLFTPFHRADDARLRGISGTGLGLSIAQRIATWLTGELTLESTTPSGTTFRLSLPRIRAH
jgi:signal transduction histidine kinase